MEDKFYYSIGEVAEMLSTTTSQLRYWSGEFEMNVRKNRKGDRLFQKEDLEKLKKIQVMLKDEGYTIDGAKKKLKNSKNEKVEEVYSNVFSSTSNPIQPIILVTQTNEIIVSLRNIKSKLESLKLEIDDKL